MHGRDGAPWTLLLVAATAGPIVLALGFSIAYSLGGIGLLSHGWTLRHWSAVLTAGQTWWSLAYSLALAGATLALSIPAALGVAFWLGDSLQRGALRHLMFLPLAVPPIVAAMLAVQILGSSGLLSRIAFHLGWIGTPAEFPSPVFSASGAGIVLAQAALVTPFLALLFERLRRNEQVDALLQLAQALGASPAQAVLRVGIPVVLCAARATLGVYGIVLAGAFEIPLLAGAQDPSMISVVVWNRFSQFDLSLRPEAHALSALFTLVTVAGLVAVRRAGPGPGTRARAPA